MKNIIICIALLSILACNSQKTEQADTLIKNVNVINVSDGTVLDKQLVALSGGKIHYIGTDNGKFEASVVIDADNKYLIPGLWDMHVHFRGGDSLIQENKNLLPLYLANGVTSVRDAGGDITPAIKDWADKIKNGSLDGPTIFTSGPKLDGPNPTWAGSIELSEIGQVAGALDSLESIGVDYVKIYDSQISREVYLAIIHEAERRGLKTTGHMPFTVKLSEAVAAGLDASEHTYYAMKGASRFEDSITNLAIETWNNDQPLSFGQQLVSYYNSYDTVRASELFNLMAERNTAIIPTLHIGEVLSHLKSDDHTDDEGLKYMGKGIVSTYSRRLKSALNATDEGTQFSQDLAGIFQRMIPVMHQSGVNILAGSDCGAFNTYVYPGFALHEELEMLVKVGIPVKDVLKIATLNAAAFMGVEETVGTIEVGKNADLLILNSNPLEKISNAQDIYYVTTGDKIYSKNELDKMLSKVGQ